jgi:hypothetical protein
MAAISLTLLAEPDALSPAQARSEQSHLEWVEATMKRMATIQVGMTRSQMLEVFAEEGGLSTPSRRTYVSRDCPYFKVDFEFQTVGTPVPSARVQEDPRDVIVAISRPYLQPRVLDF